MKWMQKIENGHRLPFCFSLLFVAPLNNQEARFLKLEVDFAFNMNRKRRTNVTLSMAM